VRFLTSFRNDEKNPVFKSQAYAVVTKQATNNQLFSGTRIAAFLIEIFQPRRENP
jgi:hypothetical protein